MSNSNEDTKEKYAFALLRILQLTRSECEVLYHVGVYPTGGALFFPDEISYNPFVVVL